MSEYARAMTRARLRGEPAPAAPARHSLPIYTPCQHEGAVIEYCKSCGPAEPRHVRDCAHPDNPTETCTRARVSGKVWSCDRCEHHTARPAAAVGAGQGWELDARHARVIRDTLRTGRFRRVLEIGSYRGYSSTAFLAAAKAGEVDHVDLCEPNPTPELLRVVARHQLGNRVTVHRCTSADLLASGREWDLVFVDGDHSAPVAEAEAAALLAANIRAVFVHDTHATAAGIPNCDGPPLLAEAFLAAGYRSIEDAADRPGERTSRGLFFAARDPHDFAAAEAAYRTHCPALSPGPLPPAELRILFCSHYLERDGAPLLLLNLVTRLRHVRATLFSWHDGPLRERYEAAGIRVIVGDLPDVRGFDVIVGNTLAAAPAVRAARDVGIPCVWMTHEYDPAMTGNIDAVRELFPTVAASVFPSAAVLEQYRGITTTNPQIVPTVIPPVPIRDRATARRELGYGDEFAILSLGRDEERKGQADIRAAVEGMPGVRLVTASNHPDPHTLHAAADLYVCSSRVEAFPLSTQEAAAHGVPLISTPAGLLSGAKGAEYQPGDVAALRTLIEYHQAAGRRPEPTGASNYDETLAAYESIFRGAARRPPPPELRTVYHVAGMGRHWQQIVREQLDQLRAAGLLRVHVTHVGTGLPELISMGRAAGVELVICSSDHDLKQYERPGIRLARRLAEAADGPVLYLHSKGVSRPLNDGFNHEWRRLMMRETVGKVRDHVADLAAGRFDAAGVNWWTTQTHFSGNFWIASADWLRRLPDPDAYYRDRWSCERWVGAAPGCRAKSLLCTDRQFWDKDIGLLHSLLRDGAKSPPA